MICYTHDFYIAQTTATLSLSHKIMISGRDATVTFAANCPAEFFCEIDGGGYDPCKNLFNIYIYTQLCMIQAPAPKRTMISHLEITL